MGLSSGNKSAIWKAAQRRSLTKSTARRKSK
jgi:hypothetical protein